MANCYDFLSAIAAPPPIFNWNPSVKLAPVYGYDNYKFFAPLDPFWIPLFPVVPAEPAADAITTRLFEQFGEQLGSNSCVLHNARNQTAHYGTRYDQLDLEFASRGYTDATVLFFHAITAKAGHWIHGADEQAGKWPAHVGAWVPFSHNELPDAIKHATDQHIKNKKELPFFSKIPWVEPRVNYWCRQYIQTFLPATAAMIIADHAKGGLPGKVQAIRGIFSDLADLFPVDTWQTALADFIEKDKNHRPNPIPVREALLKAILKFSRLYRPLAPGELEGLVNYRLLKAGWKLDGKRGATQLHAGFGELSLSHLPHCKAERTVVTIEDITRDGVLLPAAEAIEICDKKYGDIKPPVTVAVGKKGEQLQVNPELYAWVKEEAPEAAAGAASLDGAWTFLPDMLEEMQFDLTRVVDIEHRDGAYEDADRKQYSTVEFKVGSDSWCVFLGVAKWAPTGYAKQDAAKLRAVSQTEEILIKVETEHLVNAFDDWAGVSWMKSELKVDVDRVNTRFDALPKSQQKAFRTWAESAVRTDGWAHCMNTYDGRGFTGAVLTRSGKRTALLGYAYWRT